MSERKIFMSHTKILKLVELAVLTAIILVLSFTSLGYPKFGPVEMCIVTVPVIVGAIVLGPGAGAFLGAIFGLTSFYQCFGMSALGVTMFAFNPLYAFVTCFVPRVLVGLLCGLIFKGLSKIDKTKISAFLVSSLSGAIFNTVLFLGSLYLLFRNCDAIIAMQQSVGAKDLFTFIIAIAGTNGAIEAGVCTVLGTAISTAVYTANKKLK